MTRRHCVDWLSPETDFARKRLHAHPVIGAGMVVSHASVNK